jgi:uncharacterized protein DUF5682
MPGNDRVSVFGIRHHGPGSARSLLRALEDLMPDAVLVEGPPDADAILPLAASPEMRPPVALLVYRPDDPQQAAYYPFAEFSPEWQAIRFALARAIPVRFMDLPLAHELAAGGGRERRREEDPDDPSSDPLGFLGRAAGYRDGERWWEHMVEERHESAGLFAGILEAMTALRAAAVAGGRADAREERREAYMRKTIRAALREGKERVAVVCGAWHAPALTAATPARADEARLRGLPRVKVAATWVPWTHGRLSAASGYGAGIRSPGWYQHLYQSARDDIAAGWMIRVARLLRDQDLPASSSDVIDAVRLAEATCALRGRPVPGLGELTEATRAVLCGGSDAPMRVVHRRLIVGETLGGVPEDTPLVPLLQDLAREQRRLRLPPDPAERVIDLDLRKPNDLARSHLLHRLRVLGVSWGETAERDGGKTAGTFHEVWRLAWDPELALALVEAGIWGNTIAAAAAARARDLAERAADLPRLCALLDAALLSDLPDAAAAVMARLQGQAAVTGDVGHLMRALPPLARVARYGNVRQTDAAVVTQVAAGMVARICVGLPGAAASLDDPAAAHIVDQLRDVNQAIALVGGSDLRAPWHEVLGKLADREGLHGLVAGRAARILFDARAAGREATARRAALALSPAVPPERAAAWVEGFLRRSGLLLVHDDELWQLVDEWLDGLGEDTFVVVLPLLRRTCAGFAAGERRQLLERSRAAPGRARSGGASAAPGFRDETAAAVMPLVARILGVEP